MELTNEEKSLLDLAFSDSERIWDGNLLDYQIVALNDLRTMMKKLYEKYPNFDLAVISFTPKSKTRPAEIQFIQKDTITEYTMTYSNNVFADNFYDVPFEKEYDKIVEEILNDNDIKARVYTVFPFLISDNINSAKELFDYRPHLGRNTELFISVSKLPDLDYADQFADEVQKVFIENSIYTSGIIFFVLDIENIKYKNIIELDEYVRDRANIRNVLSVTFRCFNVK